MTTIDEAIKHMVERFLAWKLPADFSPDGGVAFTPMFNEHTAHPQRHEPSGTNLLTYKQAEAMVRHLLAGSPLLSSYDEMKGRIEEAVPALQKVSSVLLNYNRVTDAEKDEALSALARIRASFVSREKVDGGARG